MSFICGSPLRRGFGACPDGCTPVSRPSFSHVKELLATREPRFSSCHVKSRTSVRERLIARHPVCFRHRRINSQFIDLPLPLDPHWSLMAVVPFPAQCRERNGTTAIRLQCG